MRINNNLMAMNTHRQLGVATNSGAKATEKLSSGFRINRAGDDAAGLAISEKMRGQIRGLTQASRNAQDGISLIQTAEGALNETHAILQRMRELAVQSSTDTNTEVDRSEIQKEIDQLAEEITRIADTTEFNTQNLLGGNFEGVLHIGANEGQNITLAINNMASAALGVEGNVGLVKEITAEVDVDISGSVIKNAAAGDKFQVEKLGQAQTVGGIADVQYLLRDSDDKIVGVSADGATYKLVQDGQSTTNVIKDVSLGTGVDWSVAATHTKIVSGTIEVDSVDNNKLTIKADATLVDTPKLASGEYTISATHISLPSSSKGLINANGDLVAYALDADNIWKTLDGEVLFTKTLGNAGEKVTIGGAGIDVSSQVSADKAITIINDALETVSAERSKLGAYQNRLEHTIKNLDTSAENLQASESRIRDVDMAQEMMEFTKQNILQQASTAMLAQANVAPQSVLQLLQ